MSRIEFRQGFWHRLNIPVILVAIGLVGGCGQAKAPDQLIVKGDKFEVTLQEYDQLLRQAPPVAKEAVAPIRRALLDQLIADKLFAEAATKAGLLDDLDTSQSIAAATRGILAQAYIRKMTGKLPKPDPREVEKYYRDHPVLYSQRRKFVLDEYVLQSDIQNLDQYLKVFNVSGMPALQATIAEKIPGLEVITLARFSDELPDDRSGMLAKLIPGSNIVYQSPGQIHLASIRSITVEPLPLAQAYPRIEQSLTAEKAAAIRTAATQNLRSTRHVVILNKNLKEAAAASQQQVLAP